MLVVEGGKASLRTQACEGATHTGCDYHIVPHHTLRFDGVPASLSCRSKAQRQQQAGGVNPVVCSCVDRLSLPISDVCGCLRCCPKEEQCLCRMLLT